MENKTNAHVIPHIKIYRNKRYKENWGIIIIFAEISNVVLKMKN